MSQYPPVIPQYSSIRPKSSSMAVASLVLGPISVVMFCFWYLAIPCAILAIVLGAVARSNAKRGLATGEGMALAGILCGIGGLLIDLLIIGLIILGFTVFGPKIKQQMIRQQQLQQQQLQRQAASQYGTPSTMPTSRPSSPFLIPPDPNQPIERP